MNFIDTLEIVIDATGTKVWINDDKGQCVARWYRIKNLVLRDERVGVELTSVMNKWEKLGERHGEFLGRWFFWLFPAFWRKV
jgi:hypothetical protein